MKILIPLASVILPTLMIVLQQFSNKFKVIFDIVGILSTLLFGNIAAFAIYEIIENDTVFMTNIHALFLNPLFLLTGGYLGIYILYLLSLQILLRTVSPNKK